MIKISKFLFSILFVFLTITPQKILANEKLKIGLLVPLSKNNTEIGHQIIKTIRMAIKDINSSKLEIYPKDTGSNPTKTLKSASEFNEMGINIVIGPVFHKSLTYLDKIENITFLSFTNKTIDLPKNIISSGVNATSQLNAIKKFIELNEIKKTIFLTPKLDYEEEIKKAIKQSDIKILKNYFYDTEPTKLTQQIEKITNYKTRNKI